MTEDRKNSNKICGPSDEEFHLPDDDTLEEQVDLFKAIADPTRLSILYLLEGHELCTQRIQTELDKSQPTISHHLKILKKAKLIKSTKKGVWIYYKLRNPKFIETLKNIQKNKR